MSSPKQKSRINIPNEKIVSLFARPWFAWFGVFTLVATTICWAIVGSFIHQTNADELIDPYLFGSSEVFNQALFPGAHTFLIKWPVFLFVSLARYADWSYMVATIVLSLVTIIGLIFFLRKIESRPMLFGMLCLFMSAVLLMVPIEPYAGSLLPVSMGMMATRNIEYIVLIVALWLIVRAASLRRTSLYIGLILLLLLFASDRLFVNIVIAGAVLLALYGWIRKRDLYRHMGVRVLVVSIVAMVFAKLLLLGINAAGITHIVDDARLAPFNLTSTPAGFLRAVFFVIMGALTNLGVNPLFDIVQPNLMLTTLKNRVMSAEFLAAVLNIGIYALAGWTLWKSPRHEAIQQKLDKDPYRIVAVLLGCITLSSFAAFVIADHYYPVDARYITILFFAVFSLLAVGLKPVQDKRRIWLVLSGLAIVSILCGLMFLYSQQIAYRAGNAVVRNQRNNFVLEAMREAKIDTIFGNYWRVSVIRHQSKNTINAMATDNCLDPRLVLNSGAWQRDLSKTSFGYLLILDNNEPGAVRCSYEQIVAKFGKPNYSVVIDGSNELPKEMLLIFEHSSEDSITVEAGANEEDLSYLPKSLRHYADGTARCPGKTIMTIVAHQDDDLLFMNPHLMNSIDEKACVRTVYITAGDAGQPGKNAPYWVGRERGAQAAYARMIGIKDSWTAEPLQLLDGITASYAVPRDPRYEDRVSLISLRLPDGNIGGQGFPASRYESLRKVLQDTSISIHSVDGDSVYARDGLVDALTSIMGLFEADELNLPGVTGAGHDHSDHVATAELGLRALDLYKQTFDEPKQPVVRHFKGYNAVRSPENVRGNELLKKQDIFMHYAVYDAAVCQNLKRCYSASDPTYGRFLDRQYLE